MSANSRQVGGDHYGPGISLQHWDVCELHGIGYLESAATKYISRHTRKGKSEEDLEKAWHYMDKLMELHQQGRREPRGHAPQYVIDKWALSIRLGPTEKAICSILMQDWCEASLAEARRMLSHLMLQHTVDLEEEKRAKHS